jgi:hypothetical protein
MDEMDETAITEITIHPDGRVFVFGLSREVAEVLEAMCSPSHPLHRSLNQSEFPSQQQLHHEPTSPSAE